MSLTHPPVMAAREAALKMAGREVPDPLRSLDHSETTELAAELGELMVPMVG